MGLIKDAKALYLSMVPAELGSFLKNIARKTILLGLINQCQSTTSFIPSGPSNFNSAIVFWSLILQSDVAHCP